MGIPGLEPGEALSLSRVDEEASIVVRVVEEGEREWVGKRVKVSTAGRHGRSKRGCSLRNEGRFDRSFVDFSEVAANYSSTHVSKQKEFILSR